MFGAIQLNGCSSSSGDIFTTSYQNVVSYFNTYYNARKAFDQAVEETEKAKPKTQEIRLFTTYVVPQSARTKFLSVIEKCSKLIQFYPSSSLVDDALLMIGKSYFYLNELVPARRKFVELLENFPRSSLQFEARLGLAKTHYMSQNSGESLEVLKKLVEDALVEKQRDIAIEALLFEGQIYVDLLEYPEAIEAYEHAREINGDDRLRAFAQFHLAQCHQTSGDARAASEAYVRVGDFDPDFLLEYRARLGAAVMFSALGDFKRGLDLLDDLGDEKLSAEDRSYVDLETANVYQMQQDYVKALEKYTIVDSVYRHTDAAAKSYYQTGLMYEKKLANLLEAKSCYDKAKAEFAQSEVTASAAKRADILGRYLFHRGEFAKYDSLLQMVVHPPMPPPPPDTFHVEGDSTFASSRRSDAFRDTASARGLASNIDIINRAAGASVPLDTIHQRRVSNQFALGILFFVDLDQPDSAALWLTSALREYPNSKFAPRALYALAEVYRSKQQVRAADSLLNTLVKKYPDSEYPVSIKGLSGQTISSSSPDSAEQLYRAAEKALEAGNELVALRQFKEIALRHSKTPFGTKARYAVGWMYENLLFNTDSATAHYRSLVRDYPQSVYADRVRPKLSIKDNSSWPDSLRSSPSKTQLRSGKMENAKESAKQIPDRKTSVSERPSAKPGQQTLTPDSTQMKNEDEPR